MELVRTNSLLAVLYVTVLVLCPVVRGGCKDELIWNSGFRECVRGYRSVFGDGEDSSDPDEELKQRCSPGGKAAIICFLGYMQDCPELSSRQEGVYTTLGSLGSIPGFDIKVFMDEGGLDGYCAMMYSPCREVMKCSEKPSDSPEEGRITKRGAPSPINYYMMFNKEAVRQCGNSKEQISCKLKALDKCPDRVLNKAEAMLEKAIDMSVPVTYGLVSYKDELRFLRNTCPKLSKHFADVPCTMGVYVSHNFKMCNEKVIIEYSKQKSCAVHELSKQCITEYVQPRCGKDVAMILAKNTFMIFPGIPSDCEDRISGSDVKTTSFGMSESDVTTTSFGISDSDVKVKTFPFGISDSDVKRASFGLLLICFAFIYIL